MSVVLQAGSDEGFDEAETRQTRQASSAVGGAVAIGAAGERRLRRNNRCDPKLRLIFSRQTRAPSLGFCNTPNP